MPSWSKKGRMNGLLRPLAPVVAGEATGGELQGSYEGYAVHALARRGFPIQTSGSAETNAPPVDVESFQLTLRGVEGRSPWHCQSSPGSLRHAIAAQVTAGRVLKAFRPGEFRFEGVDTRAEASAAAWTGLIKRLGIPAPDATADPAVHQRLVDSGLFDELSALRWGGHPYLPRVEFAPPARELVGAWGESGSLDRAQPLQAALQERMSELDAKGPGRLTLEVEVGKARVPSPERFRELLDAAVRIAKLNIQANPPTGTRG
jgi:hypothetical protein